MDRSDSVVVTHVDEVVPEVVGEQDARGVCVQWLISQSDGAPTFALRRFEVDPDGHTPFHDHPWEHEVFVLTGSGVVRTEEGTHTLRPGSVAFIPPGVRHTFENTGDGVFAFLCVVPHQTICSG